MPEENLTQDFRLRQNRWNKKLFNWRSKSKWIMSVKHKNVCRVLSYIGHLLIVTSTITVCVSLSVFASLVGIPIGTTS